MIVTLALGIGLDTGVFTLIDGMLFRPRVAYDPESFVEVSPDYAGIAGAPAGPPLASVQDYSAFRGAQSLRDLAAWAPAHATLDASTDERRAIHVPLLVTCNFFDIYGPERPLIGRVFQPEDCSRTDRAATVIIGEALWRSHFAADPRIVGTVLTLNHHPFTIVGVMPAGSAGQLRAPIWVPYIWATPFFAGRDLNREPATPWLLGMVGRLRPGYSRAAATAELAVIAHQQDGFVPGRKTAIRLTNGSMIDAPLIREMAVWIVPLVMGALALVLLIACANVAMLMLSRSAARQQEIAVRLSLGASRWRLLRMLLTESLLLAACAGPPSVYLAYNVPIVFRKLIPTLPYYPFALDATVLGYLAAVTIVAGVLAGIAPAIESLKPDVSASLHGRETLFGVATSWRLRDVLVAAQMAMSLVLLVGAALFVRAELRMVSANPGYESDRVLLVMPRIGVPPHSPESAASFYQALVSRVVTLPGVRAATYSSAFSAEEPSVGAGATNVVGQAASTFATASVDVVSPQYFNALGIPILRGELFREGGEAGGVPPIIVSQSLARALWPGRDPLGELVTTSGAPRRSLQVVGVARDIRSMTTVGAGERTLYRVRDTGSRGDALLVRFDGDERRTAGAIRDAIAALDPNAVAEPRTLTALRMERASKFLRLVTMVLFLGTVAVALAVIGIYGVVSFAVSRRVKEMGIRVALGAAPVDIIRLVLSDGTKPIASGVAAGAVLALLASQALTRIFRYTPVQIDPRDPVAYTVVVILLTLTAVAAMVGPARRAASAEPAEALRQE
jgi:predicted permease